MNKKGVHLVRYLQYFLFIFIIYIAVTAIKQPTITGYAVYQEETIEKNWDFNNPADYTYDDSLIDLSNQQAELIPEITVYNWTTEEITEFIPTSAFIDHNIFGRHDKTTEIQAKDGDYVLLDKNRAFLDVTFETSLDNGDVVSLYLLHKFIGETDIYLCDETTFCDPPGYGLVHFDGDEGGYNITVSGLSSPQDTFAVDPPDPVKIDYIKATHIEYEQHSSTNTTYPLTAEIETNGLEPENWHAWGTFSADEQLNNQEIQYQYSTDSGDTWTDIPENNDLSQINSSKIRIKAILSSDETDTPILNSINLNYIIQFCTPQPTNTSWSDWADLEKCRANDLKLQQKSLTQYDSNNCEETENFTFIEQQYTACDYCSLNNCASSFEESISSEDNFVIIDALNKTNTFLEINTTNNIGAATVSIVEYNQTSQDAPESISINKYLEIESDIENINSVKITVYYTDEEISTANIDENSLKIFYRNSTSGEWEELDSTVNTSGNYVCATVSHLSLYGLFGKEKTAAAESASSGGGNGDSGGGVRRVAEGKEETMAPETFIKTESEESPQETLASGTICSHVLEVFLPEKISLLEQDSYEGEIINKGDCAIQKLNLYASSELSSIISFSPAAIIDLAPGNKSNFQIIRRTEKREWPFSLFTGSAIAGKMMAKEISGTVTIEGVEEEESFFTKDLPIDIEILAPEKIIRTIKIAVPGVGFIALILVLTIIWIRRRRRIKQVKDLVRGGTLQNEVPLVVGRK